MRTAAASPAILLAVIQLDPATHTITLRNSAGEERVLQFAEPVSVRLSPRRDWLPLVGAGLLLLTIAWAGPLVPTASPRCCGCCWSVGWGCRWQPWRRGGSIGPGSSCWSRAHARWSCRRLAGSCRPPCW